MCVCERGKIKIRKKMAGGGKKKEKNRLPSGAQRRKEKEPRLPNLRAINNKEGKKKILASGAQRRKEYTCLMHAEKESEISAVTKPARAINNTQRQVS